jgi:beta-lactamase regulating signal transducer with metallopeptidase domain
VFNDWLIPDYWLTGLGSWAISYLLHSTVILGSILLLTHFARPLSQSSKDVLLKVGLVAGILTASMQFVQNSNGLFIKTLVFDIEPAKHFYSYSSSQPQSQQSPVVSPVAANLPLIIPDVAVLPARANDLNSLMKQAASIDGLRGLLLFWLVGSSFFALRFIYLWRAFVKSMGPREPLNDEATVALCQRLQTQMAIKRRLTLTQSAQITSPMAIGSAEICLPAGIWLKVDEEQLTAIIAHELAHVGRMDSLWLFFWHLMAIVFFFQPLNKLTQLSFQSRAEFLADAIAVWQTKDPVAMVNSLVSAAKLAKLSLLHDMAVHLLGRNATIVERTKRLLNENPVKTRTSLPVIGFLALLVVTAAALGLPSISLATKQVNKIEFIADQLNADNSVFWPLSTAKSLGFETTLEHHESIAGLEVELHTKDVTFTDDLDDISQIAPGGELRFVSRSIYTSASLVIVPDVNGRLNYRYVVNNEWITDQWAAAQFMQRVLDVTMGRSDEFKRNRLKAYTNARPNPVKTDAYKVTTEMLIRALDNTDEVYSAEDLMIVKAMFRSPAFFFSSASQFSLDTLKTNSPFTVTVVGDGENGATLNSFGLLEVRTRSPDGESNESGESGLVQRAVYDLNNQAFYQLFLKATAKQYVKGETEKQMAKFLVRLHFNTPQGALVWLEEQGQS